MAHNIHRSMAFSGETPWHGIGQRLPSNGTWEEIRDAANLYTVQERPLFAAGDTQPIPDSKALYRADTGTYLATVGAGYEVIQFEEMARAGVTAAAGAQAIWHTAGLLGDTAVRGWLLAELPGVIQVKGDPSAIRKFVLLTSAHDGSSSCIIANVATRVVCQNTLGAALGERGGFRVSIRHTKNAGFRLDSAAAAFRTMSQRMERFGELANQMAKVRLSAMQFERAVAAAIPIDNDGDHPKLEAQRQELRAMRETFAGASPEIRGTAWGDFQAVTEWLDWHKPVRALSDKRLSLSQREIGARMNAGTLGDGAGAKARALEEIVTLAGASLAAVRGA